MTSIGRLSLRWKIPGLIALILVLAVATLSALAYGAARRSALTGAQERLTHVAERLAGATSAGIVGLTQRAGAAAGSTVVLEALRQPDSTVSEAVMLVLRQSVGTQEPVQVALIDRSGRALTPNAPRRGPGFLNGRYRVVDHPSFSRLYENKGFLEYTLSVPVSDSGQVIGQVIQWRRLLRVTTTLALMSDLIGDSATLLIGNADGSLMTELVDSLRPPLIRDSAMVRHARATSISAAAPINGTPWAFTVEFPNATVMAPLRVLSWQSLLVAVLVVLIGSAAGELLSRGITTPLRDLTMSAESIAGGDLTTRPASRERGDEIGRLSRAMHVMAESISASHEQLERRIHERTTELQRAVTTLRETQDELVRKEKLAMLGQLSSSVGHELRNPLGVMSNAVYILERLLVQRDGKVDDCLRILRTQIQLSERIVTDLLDSVRGKSPIRQPVDVPALIREQVARVSFPEHLRVEVQIESDLPTLHVDPDQVGQILVNLLTNAVQAIDGAPGHVIVQAANSDNRVRISVRDSGPGVPADVIDRIFEPLYTTKARGIGLGLSVSRSLAEANDGTLNVTNHAEGGAVFTLDLPLDKPWSA
jgi:signal transduction histidine kinase